LFCSPFSSSSSLHFFIFSSSLIYILFLFPFFLPIYLPFCILSFLRSSEKTKIKKGNKKPSSFHFFNSLSFAHIFSLSIYYDFILSLGALRLPTTQDGPAMTLNVAPKALDLALPRQESPDDEDLHSASKTPSWCSEADLSSYCSLAWDQCQCKSQLPQTGY